MKYEIIRLKNMYIYQYQYAFHICFVPSNYYYIMWNVRMILQKKTTDST